MKKTKKIIAIVLVLAIVFGINQVLLVKAYNQYSLYGSFLAKLERANSLQGEKIMIIGGSSSNLGIDSRYLQELTGKAVANLSVSAAVPLRVYMQVAEKYANAGDVILMPLEYSYYAADFYQINEAYVDVTAVDGGLKCQDSFLGNLEYCYNGFLRSFTRLNDCLMFAVKDAMHNENTIYIADSVNEYGDFVLHENRQPTYVREIKNTQFQYDRQVVEELNGFIRRMEAKGVRVYLTYPAFDMGSIGNSESYVQAVVQMIEENFSAENVLGTPEQFSFDESYFYDTAYHLQYENRAVYTERIFACYQMIS